MIMKLLSICKKIFFLGSAIMAIGFCHGILAQTTSVSEFVHKVYVSGIPYDEASQYKSSDVPLLLQMLEDPNEKPYWANIALVLEIIGDEKALSGVIAFIERDPGGELTESHYVAKTSAIMGLGYFINKTNSKKALNYLIEGTSPNAWESRKITGLTTKWHTTVEERNQDMAKYAILGLALAGTKESGQALRQLQIQAASSTSTAAQQEEGVISQAISEHQKIVNDGLSGYYKKNHR
jgi:hypothetical protein